MINCGSMTEVSGCTTPKAPAFSGPGPHIVVTHAHAAINILPHTGLDVNDYLVVGIAACISGLCLLFRKRPA